MRELTYADAIREGIREEMMRDARVIVLGEEVGVFGGAYKVTRGLLEEFGPRRIIDTPISEIAIAGVAVGAAFVGLRPIAEIMYMDFLHICMDQLATQAAKARFMSGGKLKVPMVLRTQYSLGRVHGSQHSQFFPSVFFQVPGLVVVLPSTPQDAKGLLKEAVRQENPVVFIESGLLYRTKGPVPEEEYTIPFGRADIKREGGDITVISVSRAVNDCLLAAENLAERGIECEVLDMRTIQPLDSQAIISSVKKTGRAVVVADDVKRGGIGAEISSMIIEEAFDYLDAPVARVATASIPVPFSQKLEQSYMVSSDRVIDAVNRLVGE